MTQNNHFVLLIVLCIGNLEQAWLGDWSLIHAALAGMAKTGGSTFETAFLLCTGNFRIPWHSLSVSLSLSSLFFILPYPARYFILQDLFMWLGVLTIWQSQSSLPFCLTADFQKSKVEAASPLLSMTLEWHYLPYAISQSSHKSSQIQGEDK